jgi:hypothetical protein
VISVVAVVKVAKRDVTAVRSLPSNVTGIALVGTKAQAYSYIYQYCKCLYKNARYDIYYCSLVKMIKNMYKVRNFETTLCPSEEI